MITGTGGVLLTWIEAVKKPWRPPESVAEAVIKWLPIDRWAENEGPEPSAPSRSEDQARPAERSPSSVSVADPVKAMAWPAT